MDMPESTLLWAVSELLHICASRASTHKTDHLSGAIWLQVDQILQLEPSQDDLRVELPLQALLDTQDSYEQWQNSSLTREYDVGKLIGLIDNLVSSLTVQRSSVKVLTILKQVFPFQDWQQKVQNSTLKQEVEARVSAWMH